MASVDELFKRPNLPNSVSKRKRNDPRNFNDIYKTPKTSVNGDVKGKRHAAVEDEVPAEDEDDLAAGPELPPDDDEEAGPEPEDEEGGRFFGGGINRHTNDVLDYMEAQDEQLAEPEKIDNAWLRRTMLAFEKKISKNRELRTKFPDDPMKFIESEGDLDADIKALSILSEHPELYPELVKLGSANSLVQLFLHENTDLGLNAISILAELTDEDVAASEEQWNALVTAMLDADVVDLLLSAISNLDENVAEDREGVYHSLELLENLCSQASTLERMITADTDDKLLKFLLARAQKTEKPISQNTQYAAELLAIIASQSPSTTTEIAPARTRLAALDAVDSVLQLLAPYRKRDPPRDTDEEEYAENLFDVLDCLADSADGKQKLVEAEGIELALIMLREGGKFSKPRAIRLLDHAASGFSIASRIVCQRFIAAAGLKPLFKAFMTLEEKKHRGDTEHILGVLASLLRCLPGDSAERIRTLAKFAEKKFEKVERLCTLRTYFSARLAPIAREMKQDGNVGQDAGERAAKEMDWLDRRLDAGLVSFQLVDLILAWLAAEDSNAAEKIKTSLGQDESAGIKVTLSEQLEGSEEGSSEDDKHHKDMLKTLVELIT